MRPGVLLDRDGTIIIEKHYLSDPDQAVLETGAAEGLRRLAALGLELAVVSNQAGVGRGLFPIEAAHAVNARVTEMLASERVSIVGWYMCPHAPDAGCRCRKPLPGMAIDAAAAHGFDLAQSFVIGDKRIDVELGHAVGAVGVLLTTGHGMADRAWAEANGVPVCADLIEAADVISRIIADRQAGASPAAAIGCRG